MFSYKRDVLERQSLSEVKMSRGSPIFERVCKKIVEYFKNKVPQLKLQRLCKSHHLLCITSSKDSEKLEKSLCVFYGQTSPNLIFLLEITEAVSSSVLSAFSSKASISDGMGVHNCIRYGKLACFGRHYEC